MAKLLVVALVFSALAAFGYADTTIVTTTIEEDSFDLYRPQQSCSRQLQGQQLHQCRNYLQQTPYGQQQEQQLQQCCNQLERIDQQCQCKAIKQVFQEAQEQVQQQQQQGSFGSQHVQQLKDKAQNLPNRCNLRLPQQCQIQPYMTVDATGMSSHQCRQQVQGRRFNQCQNYVREQAQSQSQKIRPFWKHGQQPSQEVQQCCQELQNVDRQCQCEAVKEVMRKIEQQQQQQQQPWSQQGSQFQPQQMMGEIKRIVQQLPNQCNLQQRQCQIPSEMF